MIRSNLPVFLPALIAVGMSACSPLATPYQRPELPSAQGWPRAGAEDHRIASADWWKSFGSANIDQLATAVLAANPDVAAAALRAQQALLLARQGQRPLFPSVTASADLSRSADLKTGTWTGTNTASLGASYELDLWGKLAARATAAELEAKASREDLETARTTVVASAIEIYWRLAAVNQQIAFADQSLHNARTNLELAELQLSSGTVSPLDQADATQALAAQEAAMTDLVQSRVALRSGLVLLLGGQHSPVPEPTALPGRTPFHINPGLPADILLNRPDLRAAELRLRSTLKGVDAARASLLPSLTLTASAGGTSPKLKDILANPVATLGQGLVLPFLNAPEGRLAVKVSELRYEEAVVEFRKSLLAAFSDVAVALSAQQQLALKAGHLRDARDAAQTAARLTSERYSAGAVGIRPMLDAQDRSRETETALVLTRLEQLLNELQLLRVLGASPPS